MDESYGQKRILFVVNQTSKLTEVIKQVIELTPNSSASFTKSQGDATRITLEFLQKFLDEEVIVVAVGGDGTCNEVVNGIVRAEHPRSIFAIVPNGTGNDFHRSLGDFEEHLFAEALIKGKTKEIDIIKITTSDNVSYGLNITGVGFDGYVVHLLNQQRTKWKIRGKASYVLAIFRGFLSYKKPVIKIASEEFDYKGEVLMAAVCNGTTFGNGLTVNPMAIINDGLLSVSVFKKVSLLSYIRYLPKLKKGIKVNHPEVEYFNTKKVIMSSMATPIIEADGELIGKTPVTFEIMLGKVKLLVPSYKKGIN